MSLLRHLSNVVRGRRLLATGAFLFLAYLFANNLTPRPRYVAQTGAKARPFQERSGDWTSCTPPRTLVNHVSDDGGQVIVGVRGSPNRLELWDVRTGVDRRPAHWIDTRWLHLVSTWNEPELDRLLADPGGRTFVMDSRSWVALNERWAPSRAATGRPYPSGLCFSPDGRWMSYVRRDRSPGRDGAEQHVDRTVIEDMHTGHQVVLPPGAMGSVVIAPGARTGVSWACAETGASGSRWLRLWDLASMSGRCDLRETGVFDSVMFSPDGRYVFACHPQYLGSIRWWDTESGIEVGQAVGLSKPHFLGDGRLLVRRSDDYLTLHFWDVATGRELDDWDLEVPDGDQIVGLTFAGHRFVLAEIMPGPASWKGVAFMDDAVDWVSERVSNKPIGTSPQLLVLDAIDRRVVGRVPGETGTVSPNSQWLATLDADGVVRVWDLPLGRPWLRGFAYAAAVFAGGWVVFGLPRRLRRRAHVATAA